MNIYSYIQPEKLLHMIIRRHDVPQGRADLVPREQFLQCAALRLEKGMTFKPHKHLWHRFNGDRLPQEAWVVIKGSVKVFYYDIDDTLLHTDIICEGEMSLTIEGGHNYEILSDNSFVLEFKTGPYFGQETDKIFI